MNGVLDDCLVGVVLLAGFGYATYSLGPKSLRARLLTASAWIFGRLSVAGMRRLAERLTAAAVRSGSCGGCDNCGSNEPAGDRSAVSQGARRGGPAEGTGNVPEIRIPLSKIGKRR